MFPLQTPILGRGGALPLAVSDLTPNAGGEPRIYDLMLAERLGFDRPRKIRDLIVRNRFELETYGEVCTTVAQIPGPRGRGRPGREFWLNEGQALVLCALSRTPQAAAVRRQIIAVFMAWRAGYLAPVAPTLAPADFADLPALRQALALTVAHVERLQGRHADLMDERTALSAEVGRQGRVLADLRARLDAPPVQPATPPSPPDPSLALFLAACTRAAPGAHVQARPLYWAWAEWCRLGRQAPGSETRFALRMRAAGAVRVKRSVVLYLDLALREPRDWGACPVPSDRPAPDLGGPSPRALVSRLAPRRRPPSGALRRSAPHALARHEVVA